MPMTTRTHFPATQNKYHEPVMVEEVITALVTGPGCLVVDGTMGGGGHSQALLNAGAKIIGLDQDGGAIGHCIQHLVVYHGDTVRLKQANFRELLPVMHEFGTDKVDGILLDIGVSSAQLDRPERGFSFQKDGPLDMRMNPTKGASAADLINHADKEELVRIFRLYGEEPAATRIAAAIVKHRQAAPIKDTLALAGLIERVVPRHGPRHPATRVFQALRMAVNDELGALKEALEASVQCLRSGGRLAVITFHSLEDRIVKNFARAVTTSLLDRPEWPTPRTNPDYSFRTVMRRAIQPTAAEQHRNPRSRSAKLRVVERL